MDLKIGMLGVRPVAGNRGVIALGASLIKSFENLQPDFKPIWFVGNRSGGTVPFRTGETEIPLEVINFRLSPRAKLNEHLGWIVFMSLLYRLIPIPGVRKQIENKTPWIKSLLECDFVGDIRGGDSFSDIYGFGRFMIGFLVAWSVILVKGEIVQFPQTFGPYNSKLSRVLARYLLRNSSVIIARDKLSQAAAKKLLPKDVNVSVCPDVAFLLESVDPGEIEMTPPLNDSAKVDSTKIIGINVNGLMYNGGYTRNNMFGLTIDYSQLLETVTTRLLRETDNEIWLIPHTFGAPGEVESDPEACRKLREALPSDLRDRVRLVDREYDHHEIKGVIGQCHFFIGSRMHSCIAALSQAIPCIGVAYSRKFSGVFESVGMEDWVVDGRTSSTIDAANQTLSLFSKREFVQDELESQVARAKQKLNDTFSGLLDLYVTTNTDSTISCHNTRKLAVDSIE